MHVIAAQSNLYEVFVEQGSVQLLLQLLAHENTDIVSAVCHLLQVFFFFYLILKGINGRRNFE